MISERSRPNLNTESVTIFFIYQAVASVRILVGVLQWSEDLTPILLILGLLFKLGVAPFHGWILPVLKGSNLLIFFILTSPVKLPTYLLRDLWVEDFYPLIILRVVVGLVLSVNQRHLLIMIAASRITSTGVLLTCLKAGIFDWYFLRYRISLGFIMYGLRASDHRVVSLGLISLLGLPLFPLFLPKVSLLYFLLHGSPLRAIFLLMVFIASGLYYVKFLISGFIELSSRAWRVLSALVLISLFPIA